MRPVSMMLGGPLLPFRAYLLDEGIEETVLTAVGFSFDTHCYASVAARPIHATKRARVSIARAHNNQMKWARTFPPCGLKRARPRLCPILQSNAICQPQELTAVDQRDELEQRFVVYDDG
jgi:hypothetical protein